MQRTADTNANARSVRLINYYLNQILSATLTFKNASTLLITASVVPRPTYAYCSSLYNRRKKFVSTKKTHLFGRTERAFNASDQYLPT